LKLFDEEKVGYGLGFSIITVPSSTFFFTWFSRASWM